MLFQEKKFFYLASIFQKRLRARKKTLLFFHYYIYIEPESACLQISNVIRNSMHKAQSTKIVSFAVNGFLISLFLSWSSQVFSGQ